MKNIFILYIPTGNPEALIHYEDTIKNKISQDRLFRYLDPNLKYKLINVFGNNPIATWGSRNSTANRQKYERMQIGDDIMIVEGEKIKLLGKIAGKTINSDLSKELWKNLKGESKEGWDLVYFIANPLEINLHFNEFKQLFGYKPEWQLRGFTSIAQEKLDEFYSRYDDLYSILQRIKEGERIEEKRDPDTSYDNIETKKIELQDEDIEEILENEELSDHIKIQWKLIRLGMKAGSKVWIPRNDQSKIKKEFDYDEFEKEFTTGIDTQTKYVENIDVIWKREFRIDAAFEVENTTAIYSGLLRFSDLTLVAPNSTYPLFIVAPTSKKHRLLEQIKRPTFQELNFQYKVKYLSYEMVEDVDKFFENTDMGLNIDVLTSKAEALI